MFRAIYGVCHKLSVNCLAYFADLNPKFELFTYLPKDIQILILSELSLKDFKNIARVSKGMHQLVHSAAFWYPKIYRDFPSQKCSIENCINKPTKQFYLEALKEDHPKLYNYQKKIYYQISDNDLVGLKKSGNCAFSVISNIFRNFGDKGYTPVHFAALLRRYAILDYFFSEVIKPHFATIKYDSFGDHLLTWAIRCLQPVSVLEQIRKDYDISMYHLTRYKGSVMLEAVLYGHTAALNYYFDMGYPVNQKQERTETPFLYFAAQEGLLDVVKLLIKHGANVNDISKDDQATPIIAAVEFGHYDCFKYLLDHGADINAPRVPVQNGEKAAFGTPLTIAAWFGYKNIVEALLHRSSLDIDALGGVETETDYLRADDLAEKNGFDDIAKMIRMARYERSQSHCVV